MARLIAAIAAQVALLPLFVGAAMPIQPSNVLFGHAIKGASLPPNTELTTFQHNCSTPPCAITQIHVPSIYPGNGCASDWEHGRLRVYVDGEATASIDVALLEIAATSFNADVGTQAPKDTSPWGHALFGKTANNGGVYTTIRIPFQQSIRTTIQASNTCQVPSVFWFLIRGLENFSVQLGEDFVLPPGARLNIQRNSNVTLQPLDYITIANVTSASAGALLAVYFDAQSTDFNFLEACVRFYPNGASTPTYLSSGTEDYFLSSSYFDEGKFTTPEAGCTFQQGPGSMSAYKVHTRDYIFWANGMVLTWRNMENSCPTSFPWNEAEVEVPVEASRVGVAPATYNTLAWFYTWPAGSTSAAAGAQSSMTEHLRVLARLHQNGELDAQAFQQATDMVLDGDHRVTALLDAFAADPALAVGKHIARLVERAART